MTWNNETRDIKDGKKESLFSELHSLLSSGLDFGRSFRLLIEGENDKRLKRVLESIYASVVKGQTLWESFAAGERFTAIMGFCGLEKRRDVLTNHCVSWLIIIINGWNSVAW